MSIPGAPKQDLSAVYAPLYFKRKSLDLRKFNHDSDGYKYLYHEAPKQDSLAVYAPLYFKRKSLDLCKFNHDSDAKNIDLYKYRWITSPSIFCC